jgi:hypothetical protein
MTSGTIFAGRSPVTHRSSVALTDGIDQQGSPPVLSWAVIKKSRQFHKKHRKRTGLGDLCRSIHFFSGCFSGWDWMCVEKPGQLSAVTCYEGNVLLRWGHLSNLGPLAIWNQKSSMFT